MQLQGVRFPEAVHIVAERSGIVSPSGQTSRAGWPRRPKSAEKRSQPSGASASPSKQPAAPEADRDGDTSTGLARAEAIALVEDSTARLWTPEGSAAREYLFRVRGLTEETVRRHRLGWTPRAWLPNADHTRYWRASGVTIPWFDEEDRLALVKIRGLDGARLRYAEAFRDRPAIYPGLGAIGYGIPLIVVEGEFEALLLGQELAGLASVITTGGSSSRPSPESETRINLCWPVYAAHDADDSGEKAAAVLPARSIRVRPPAGKDWTEALGHGIDLRRWWLENVLVQRFDRE
jgi:DNA primase